MLAVGGGLLSPTLDLVQDGVTFVGTIMGCQPSTWSDFFGVSKEVLKPNQSKPGLPLQDPGLLKLSFAFRSTVGQTSLRSDSRPAWIS